MRQSAALPQSDDASGRSNLTGIEAAEPFQTNRCDAASCPARSRRLAWARAGFAGIAFGFAAPSGKAVPADPRHPCPQGRLAHDRCQPRRSRPHQPPPTTPGSWAKPRGFTLQQQTTLMPPNATPWHVPRWPRWSGPASSGAVGASLGPCCTFDSIDPANCATPDIRCPHGRVPLVAPRTKTIFLAMPVGA